MTNKKVLVISYFFPPIGGSGVQRILKYVKYLPEYGWDPVVLTVKPITYSVYDSTLLETISDSTKIVRTESLDPLRLTKRLTKARAKNVSDGGLQGTENSQISHDNNLLKVYRSLRTMFAFPDVQLGWLPFALQSGINQVKAEGIDVIIARIPPYSNGILANLISQRTGVPYILDFADAWLDDPYLKIPTPLHKWGHSILERRVVSNAQAVVTCSDTIQQNFLRRYSSLENKTHVLYNGFDPDDYSYEKKERSPHAKKKIVYMGSLYVHHEPNFLTLLEALKSIPDDLRNSLEVTFVGQFFDKAIALSCEAGLEDIINFTGYIPHSQAAEFLSNADASLLFVKPGDKESLTGKVFEYLTTTTPLIALIEPDGELGELLNKVERGRWIVSPTDSKELVKVLEVLAQQGWPEEISSNLNLFDRKLNTGRLANILRCLTSDVENTHDVGIPAMNAQ